MKVWKNQRGDVPVGCLIGFVLLVLIAIFAMNTIPAQVDLGEFEKRVEELADRANRREYTNARIQAEILEKAKDLDLAVTDKNIEIDRTDKRIKIFIEFDQEIRYPGYVWVRHHEIRLERPIF
ncbi:MAG TPA: hypothetical protein VLB51_11370 [Methylomirabilota bacterium]|nr:hypothetical protein [Methylomirabilota bacterium]